MPRLTMISALSALVLAAPVWAQVDPAAKDKLQAMSDAVGKLKSLQYEVVSRGEGGMLATFTPVTSAKVMLQRAEKGWKQRREGKAEGYGMPESKFLLVSDGAMVRWADDRNKTFNERPEGQVSSDLWELSKTAFVSEFIVAQPWAKELNSSVITALPGEQVEGEACDVVLVDLGSGPGLGRTKFAIATSDHLPRKITSYVQNLGEKDALSLTLSNVKIDATPPEGSFAISKPDGYTVIGPVPQTPAPRATPATPDSASAPAAPRPGTVERAIGGNVGDLAPDFELASTTGEKVKLSGLRGGVTVLDFWGTWCIPCRKASPDLQKLSESYKDKGVRVVSLAVREKDDAAPGNYMKEHNYTYTALLKGDDTAKAYKVKSYPTTFVIGPDGVIVGTMGYEDGFYTKLSALVDKALGAGKPGDAKPADAKPAEAGKDAPKSGGH